MIPAISPGEPSPETEELFSEILRVTGSPQLTNMWKTLANSLPVLTGTWRMFHSVFFQTNLPIPVKAMIMFSISSANQCTYCSAFLEVTCRTLGVEEASLRSIVGDLDSLNPERVQVIIRFAQRCARSPYSMTEEEFDTLRNFGINDEEILEIISLAAMGNYFDTIADSLKMETDDFFIQQLPGGPLVTREDR
jgi:uncharacterized peroxidase-related enzyme